MNVLFLSSMLWDETGGAYAPTQLALQLSKRGHRVLFLEHRASRTRDTRGLNIAITSLEELGVPPLLISLAWRGVHIDSLEKIFAPLAEWLEKNCARDEPSIAILNAPFAPLARLIPFLQTRDFWTVYYPQDNYGAMFELGMHQFNPRLEEILVTRSDLNLALAQPIAEKLKASGRDVFVLPDAVDPTEFQNAAMIAPNVVRGQECTIGMWGSLVAPMVDSALLREIAERQPRWTIHLIGPHHPPPQYPSVYEQLRDVPNIFFHGPIAHSELKTYARAFDVCLIPAPDNAMSRGRDPIKLYEYLACYKPVVATHMPQLAHAPYVCVASNAAECINAIEHARAEVIEPRVIDLFLAQHTWNQRAETFLELLQALIQEPRARFGAFEANEFEQLAQSQPVGVIASDEWQAVVNTVNEHSDLKREIAALQTWTLELERAQRVYEQSLSSKFDVISNRVRNLFGKTEISRKSGSK